MERPTISEAALLNREMTKSVPALLARVERLRPRIVCFNGKGMWPHVERSLQQKLLKRENPDHGIVKTEPRSVVGVKNEEEDCSPIIRTDPGQRPVKAEQEEPTAFGRDAGNTSPSGFHYGLQPYKAVHDVVPKVRKALARGFVLTDSSIWLQTASVGETLFCVFPSTSGRVVSHQVRAFSSRVDLGFHFYGHIIHPAR